MYSRFSISDRIEGRVDMSPAVLHSLLFGTASAIASVMAFAKADPLKRKASAWIISFILLEVGCFLNMYSVNSSGSLTLLMIGAFANWVSYFIIDRHLPRNQAISILRWFFCYNR